MAIFQITKGLNGGFDALAATGHAASSNNPA
jgi:hypothetical protein